MRSTLTVWVQTSASLRRNKLVLYALSLVAIVLFAPPLAHASSAGGGGLPWEAPLTTLENSIKGPVAFGVSLIGIVACGCMLIFGGEISEFTRRLVYAVLVVAVILGASNLMSTLFTTGALVV